MINYDEFLNPTLVNVQPSGIRKFFAIAEEMQNVISLGVGEPDFLTPWHIRQAGIDNLAKGATRYTANAGLAELREEISRYYARKFLVKYDPTDEILVTVGGSEGIDMAIRSIICPGDEAQHKVFVDDEEIELTYKEYEVLKLLIINKGIVLTRDKIMESIWGYDFEQGNRTVDVHIQSLRKKVKSAGVHIKTIRNVGYKVGD